MHRALRSASDRTSLLLGLRIAQRSAPECHDSKLQLLARCVPKGTMSNDRLGVIVSNTHRRGHLLLVFLFGDAALLYGEGKVFLCHFQCFLWLPLSAPDM